MTAKIGTDKKRVPDTHVTYCILIRIYKNVLWISLDKILKRQGSLLGIFVLETSLTL